MTRKTLGTALLLGLMLGVASSANADTIAITSVTVSNIQLSATSGVIVFSAPQTAPPRTAAGAVAVNDFGDESSDQEEGPTLSQVSASVAFADASVLSDFPNLLLSASSNVNPTGCGCFPESQGVAVLRLGFMVTGGTGNVDVTLSAMLETMQNLVTDQFSSFAVSDARITLQVLDVRSFSFDSSLRLGPNEATTLDRQRQLSEVLTLQFDQQYNLVVFVLANSRAATNDVPEPATMVLLVSGLGFMAGAVRKRRAKHR